jgi:hypothetical protein
MRECRECGGELEIIGTGGTGGVEVECSRCGEGYEVEIDGLDEGGLEWVEAKCIEMGNQR